MIEPTRGVDVGARLEIYRQIERLADSGTAIVVVSTDLPEIMSLAERVVTFYEGRVTAEFDPRSATEQQVFLAMQGGTARPAEGEPAEAYR